jgi:hypothetical protein
MAAAGFVFREQEETAIRIGSDDMTLENILDVEALEPLPKELGDALFAIEDLVVRDIYESPKITRYHFLNQSGGFDGLLFASVSPAISQPHCIFGRLSVNRWKTNVIPQIEITDLL